MRRPLRLLSALLAFCVLAAVFPPVGLAADPTEDLRVLIDQEEPYIRFLPIPI